MYIKNIYKEIETDNFYCQEKRGIITVLLNENKKYNILHLDDSEVFRLNFYNTFINWFNVSSTNSREEAINIINKNTIKAIIIDYEIQGFNCLEFIEIVQKNFNKIPFIILTKIGSKEIMRKSFEADASDFFIKNSSKCTTGTI